MDMNVIVSGVGGQGILSIAFVLDNAAMKEDFRFKQAEVHGMSQRGGAVQSHLRFSTEEIWSDIIPEGGADLILSVEPLEALRYLHYLKPEGSVVSSQNPFINIPDYPLLDTVLADLYPLERLVLIDSEGLAKHAGSPRAQNMVMLGASAYLFPFQRETCLEFVGQLFRAKGEKAMKINQDAFQYGVWMSEYFRAGLEVGLTPDHMRWLGGALDPNEPDHDALPVWKQIFEKHGNLFAERDEKGRVASTLAAAKEVLEKGKLS